MQVKILEVRDRGTFIPVLAIDMNSQDEIQSYYLDRCGYANDSQPNIGLTRLDLSGAKATNDPYDWSGRTWRYAHQYILDNWATLKDGDVVDVEFILKEQPTVKISERFGG